MRLGKDEIQSHFNGTLIETLNITLLDTDDEMSLEAIMPVEKKHSQTMGVLHGGATISLAETLAGVGSNVLCGNDEQCFGMQISASHVSPALIGDAVHAKAVILHKGRSTHIWNIDVFSKANGRLISSIRITNAVVKKVLYMK